MDSNPNSDFESKQDGNADLGQNALYLHPPSHRKWGFTGGSLTKITANSLHTIQYKHLQIAIFKMLLLFSKKSTIRSPADEPEKHINLIFYYKIISVTLHFAFVVVCSRSGWEKITEKQERFLPCWLVGTRTLASERAFVRTRPT